MSKLIIEVCKIKAIEKHPNADRLSIAQVKGWNCIVGLNQYKVGDLVIFCPPDSVIPANIIDKYKLEYLKKDGRVKTVKLRKFISQGLVLDIPKDKNWKEGKDVAKDLGITKYEPPQSKYSLGNNKVTFGKLWKKYIEKEISLRRLVAKTIGLVKDSLKPKKNPNPLFNKYTDIENIKNYDTVFKVGDNVVITEKIHGTNFRAGYLPIHPGQGLRNKIKYLVNKYLLNKNYEFVYGSHNVQKISFKGRGFYNEDVYGKIAKKYKLAEILPKDYVIYGEIYGVGIQELEYGMKDIDIRFFDIKYQGKYINFHDFTEFCLNKILPVVPVLAIEEYDPEKLKSYTEGKSVIAPNQIREGCVVTSLEEENNHRVGRKILKSINPEYLIKKNRTEHH